MGGMKIARAFAVLLVTAACAGGPAQAPPASGHVRLFEATSGEIAVIDSVTHLVMRHLPLGVPSADWKHLYSISGTALVDTDPASGLTSATLQLPGAYQLPAATSTGLPGGTSPNGGWLVAQSYDGAATHFVVVGTAEMRIAHTANLTGHFNFDAISDDGERLYLIQYLNGREYYVRLYNVLTGTLDENIVVDKSDGEQSMTGLRLSGIATPGGNWLFSMYVRESDNPFIHVLSLDGPFAFCLDLPGGGYASSSAERHWSIAMDRTGAEFYAVNGATGVVAQVDNSQLYNPHVTRTAHIAAGGPAEVGSNAAVLSPDGRWLIAAGSSGVVWIDTTTLAVRMRALAGWPAWSVGLSPDGSQVYALSDSGRIAGLDTATGRVISTFDTSVGRPMALMRVASA
jgi:WD40 repeat protein